jgi:Flp pilus assembly protein TadD
MLLATFMLASCVSGPDQDDFGATQEALTNTLRQAAENAERTYKFEAAASHYGRLSEREPDSILPILGQARNLRYAGAPRDAITVLRRAFETLGEQTPLLLELAKAQFASSFTADARETLGRLRELTPGDWQVYSMQAMLEDTKGRYDEAQELYRSALALSPDNLSIINNYSLSLAQAGDLTQAIQLLERIAYGEKSTIQTRQNLAMLYVLSGDRESAQKLVEGDLPPDLARENLSNFQSLAE